MAKVAIKGASYILVHAPDLLFHNGSTQTGTRLANPEDEYLKAIRLTKFISETWLPKTWKNFPNLGTRTQKRPKKRVNSAKL